MNQSRTDGIGDQRTEDLHYDPIPVIENTDPVPAVGAHDLTPAIGNVDSAPLAGGDDQRPVADDTDPIPAVGVHDLTPAIDEANLAPTAGDNDSIPVVDPGGPAPATAANGPTLVVDKGDPSPTLEASNPISEADSAAATPVAGPSDPIPVINNGNEPPAAEVSDQTPAPGRQNVPKREPHEEKTPANLARHKAQCLICRSEYREILETWFINWESPDQIIQKSVGLSRDSIYRHAHALGLFRKRARNVKVVLGKIIERLGYAPVNGSTILSAVKLLAKMESEEQARENTDPRKLFDRMSPAEREAFARTGALPEWFSGDDAETHLQ
jgi:hypothetical protein